MIIQKILVPFGGRYDPEDPESLDEPALRMALLVGSLYEAHVQVLCVTGDPYKPEERISAWLPGYGVNELIRWIHKEGDERRKRAKAIFAKTVGHFEPKSIVTDQPNPSFSTSYTEQIGDIPETVGRWGRASDLIVIASSKVRWEMPFRPLLLASLRRTGRPVLVCPTDIPTTFAKRIAIAWNDSTEAAGAIANTLGILKNAEYVTLICCQEIADDTINTENIIEYLKLHNIDAELIMLSESSRHSADKIVRAAELKHCDLLVMGAYFHARAHSLIFGSLTEYVLSDPKLPVLLSS